MRDTIDMIEEAGKVVVNADYMLLPFLKDFEALVRADEREQKQTTKQPEAVAWEGITKIQYPKGTPRVIFTDKARADEWLETFLEGYAWLKPLAYIETTTGENND
jgi:hypothetical protein